MNNPSIRVGIDLVDIDRIGRTLADFGDRFLGRLFWAEETDYYQHGSKRRFHEGISGLFAAKEAVRKILLSAGINPSWKAVLIRHGQDGRPLVFVDTHPANPFSDIQLSLSHTGNLVVAVAVGVLEAGSEQVG